MNVDETTYLFSPKVLDRAFTIELNQVDLAAFGNPGPDDEDVATAELRLTQMPDRLELRGNPAHQDWDALGTLAGGRLRKVVLDLHGLLRRSNRHFAYRVADEIGRFVMLASEQAGTDDATLWAALDLALLMKVLPKLHGTQQELEELLSMLFAFAVTTKPETALAPGAVPFDQFDGDGDRLHPTSEAIEPPELPRTAAKLWRMEQRLRQQGFTSFIE